MSKRLDQDRQNKLEPIRIQRAIDKVKELGLQMEDVTDKVVVFIYKGEYVQFYPYSGWHTGKSIVDGRGFDKLFNQIK